ncbi:Transcription factor GATA-4 [Coemansia sp. RSA 1200]|nr:Transcription factor GATA-4 [Coemansia sp. RSA 1200]
MNGLIDGSQLTQTTVDDSINVSYSSGGGGGCSSMPMLGFYSPLAGYGDSQMTSSFDLSTADHFTQQQQQQQQHQGGSSQLQVFSQMPTLHIQTSGTSQIPMFAWHPQTHHHNHSQHMYHDGQQQQHVVHPVLFCTPATGTQTPQEPCTGVVSEIQGAGAAEWLPITKVHEPVISPYFDQQRRRQQKQQGEMQQQQQQQQLHGPTALAEGNNEAFQLDALASSGFRGHLGPLGLKVCSVCKTSETPTWRRHPRTGSCVCNACGLYYKLHKRDREWIVNTRGQRVVKRQPRGSMAKKRQAARLLQLAGGRAVDNYPLNLVNQDIAQNAAAASVSVPAAAAAAVAASGPLDHHPSGVSAYSAGNGILVQPEQNRPHQLNTSTAAAAPITFSHFNPLQPV